MLLTHFLRHVCQLIKQTNEKNGMAEILKDEITKKEIDKKS